MEHRVTWKPFYSVGNASLDAEHQRLLGVIDDLSVAISAGHEQVQVKETLDRLAEYTATHFDHEEQVMRECGYPDLDAHKAMHDEMRRRTLDFHANAEGVAGQNLLRFLKEWWVRHIQNQDKAYSPYLDALARGPVKTA